MATTSISLIREQSEKVGPPRALWVPYALGRPLGSAADPEFQKAVLRASFRLLETATEPTIEDYPIEAPDEAGPGVWACPLNFDDPTADSLEARFRGEVARMRPWSAETRTARGRTLFGVSGAAADQIDEVVEALVSIATSGDVQNAPDLGIEWAFPMPLLIRHLSDDVRTVYHEAIAAQPGDGAPNHDALNHWIFGDDSGQKSTSYGEILLVIAEHLTELDSDMAHMVRGFLIPEGFYKGGSAFPGHNVSINPDN